MHTLQLLIIRPNYHEPACHRPDQRTVARYAPLRRALTTGASKPHACSASALAPWRVKPSSTISRAGAAHGQRRTVHPRERRCCLFLTATARPALVIRRPRWSRAIQLPSETVCSTVSCINAGDQPDCPERAVIFSGCMDLSSAVMQPLVKGHVAEVMGQQPA